MSSFWDENKGSIKNGLKGAGRMTVSAGKHGATAIKNHNAKKNGTGVSEGSESPTPNPVPTGPQHMVDPKSFAAPPQRRVATVAYAPGEKHYPTPAAEPRPPVQQTQPPLQQQGSYGQTPYGQPAPLPQQQQQPQSPYGQPQTPYGQPQAQPPLQQQGS